MQIRKYIEDFWSKSLEYIFRKKTLKSSLYLVIAFILGELTAISNGSTIQDFCEKLKADNPDGLVYYLAIGIDYFFGSGSYFILGVAVIICALLMFLIYKDNSTPKWTKAEW